MRKPELADGAEGQQALEVGLAQRAPAADDHRREPDGEHERPPGGDDGERRREAGDEVDAGLHHRRGVQVGRDRRRGGHGGRQPGVERHLRALGERADEHEHQRDGHRRAARRVGEDRRERRRAGLLHEQDQPEQHDQAAEGRDEQRLLRGPAALGRLVVEADEQPRGDARELPEDVEQQQVVRQDQPEHRPREGGEDPREAAEPGLAGAEVAGAVDEDERADARDQGDHEQRERVEPQVERQPEAGHPRRRRGDRARRRAPRTPGSPPTRWSSPAPGPRAGRPAGRGVALRPAPRGPGRRAGPAGRARHLRARRKTRPRRGRDRRGRRPGFPAHRGAAYGDGSCQPSGPRVVARQHRTSGTGRGPAPGTPRRPEEDVQ